MITLEISSTEIRLMEVDRGKVVKWASSSLEADLFEEGVISDPQALSVALRQLMDSSGVTGKNVTAGVSGLYSLSRIVLVPNPPGGPTTEMVLEAAQGVLPFSEEALYISWQGVTVVEGGQQVLVLGVPRDVIDSEVRALRMAGTNPRIMDLKAMALIRAVNREQALILNIESASFDIAMVVDGVAEAMRTTSWQPAELTMEERAEQLAVALELAVGFYNSQQAKLPLDPATPLFITGQMSGDSTLIEKLQTRIEYTFETLSPPLEYPEHLPVSQFAVNIGLALKDAAAPKTLGQGAYPLLDMNILPQVYQPWKPSVRQAGAFALGVAAIALLLPLYQLTAEAMHETATLETRYTIINAELQRRQAEIRNRQPLEIAIREYQTIVDMGSGFTDDFEVIRSRADELDVEVLSISHTGSGITVSCSAPDHTAFRDYLEALAESGRFSTPIPPPEGYPYITGGTIKLETKPAQ